MTARRASTALAFAVLCSLPAIASAAIVQKWQTAAGVNYRELGPVPITDDGVLKLLTAEPVAGKERIGLRSGATGALLAQSAASYTIIWGLIQNVDADDDNEIFVADASSGNIVCLGYTTGSDTLATLWSVPGGGSTVQTAFVDFDGNDHLYLVVFLNPGPGNNSSYAIYNSNGVQVAAPSLPSIAYTGSGTMSADLYVDDFDHDGQQELVIGYKPPNSTTSSQLYMLQTSTSVSVAPEIAGLPAAELGACYPNPMFSLSRIDYSVATSGPVSLRLFDVAGREVRTLVNGPVTAGSHGATWDGRDANGKLVPAGAYFYQLNAGGQKASRPVVRMP